MIQVIELFSGIGAQAEALKELGLDYEVIATSDIDRHANIGYEAIHGKVNNLGDITKIEHLPKCDLLTYSYPCTSISIAGKQEGMKEGSGTASALLWEVGRLLQDMRDRSELPEVLLMENVDAVLNEENLPEFKRWIQTLDNMGYCSSYKVLNAKDYGTPQNRRRIFMVSTLHEGKFVFPKPCPDGRVLKDVLEDHVDPSFFLSEKRLASYEEHKKRHEKAGNGFGYRLFNVNVEVSATISTKPDRNDGTFIGVKESADIIKIGEIDRKFKSERDVISAEGVSPTLTASHHNSLSRPKILVDDYIAYPSANAKGYLEARPGDGLVMGFTNKARGTVQTNTSPTLSTRKGGDAGTVIRDGERLKVRYLTPRECLRLQAFPDDAIDRMAAVLPKTRIVQGSRELDCRLLSQGDIQGNLHRQDLYHGIQTGLPVKMGVVLMVVIERDGMIINDGYAKVHGSNIEKELDKLVNNIVKQKVEKVSNEKLEELEKVRNRLRHLLQEFSADLPPEFIYHYKREINSLTQILDWIQKELE